MKKQNLISIGICALLLLLSMTFFGATAETFTEVGKQLERYDINRDGNITISDVTALLDYLATSCGHTKVALENKEATCEEEGSKGGSYCPKCEQILTLPEILPAKGHNAVTDPAVSPSCEETGLTEGTHCSVCQKVLVKQEVRPATGHSYENDLCTACGKEKTSEGLEFVLNTEGDYYTVIGIGSCTDEKLVIPQTHLGKPVKEIGEGAFEGNTVLSKVILPDSITFVGSSAFAECEGLESVTLSKNLSGIESYLFCDCPALREILLPEGIGYIDRYAFAGCDNLQKVSLPLTLESIGQRAFERCLLLENLIFPEGLASIERNAFLDCTALSDLVLPKSLTSVKAAAFSGCENISSFFSLAESLPEGWASGWKSGCDAAVFFAKEWSYINGIPTPFSHIHNQTILEFVAPTCTEEGRTEGAYCTICKTELVKQQTIPSINHIYKDGACVICQTVAESSGLSFALSDDRTFYTVTGIGTCKDSVIVIPKMHNGLYVRAIAPYAFEENDRITALVVQNTLRSIGDFAFYRCANLSKVILPQGVTTIGTGSFAETGITALLLPHGLTSIGQAAFCDCRDLSILHLPETLSTIPLGAFGNCTALQNLVIGKGISTVDFGAFEGCVSLEDLLLSKVTTLGARAFYGCSALQKLTLSNNLSSIGNLAFGECTALTELSLPESLEVISKGAFKGCSSLKELYIPLGVLTVEDGAFENCTLLAAIYCGAEKQPSTWNALWLKGCSATVYYKGSWDYIEGKPHVHQIVSLPKKDPTCTNEGLTEGTWCSICQKVFEKQQIVPALGGVHSFDDDGVCIHCGDFEPISFTVTNGLLTILGKGALLPDQNGAYPYDAFKNEITAILVGDNITEIGDSAFSRCSLLESITFGKNVTILRKDAMAYCPKLQTIFFGATITIMEQGTVWESTAIEDITLTGQTKEAFLALAATHAYNTPFESESISWHTNCAHMPVTDAALAPTCTDTGLTEGAHCSLCGDVLTAQTVVPAKGHIYDDAGDCTECGIDEPISWKLEDGVLTVRGKGAIIPDDPENTIYPWNAHKSMIREIVVTGGITEIGARAFSNCANLEKITFGKYVSILNNDVISYCDSLTEIVFNGTVTYLGQGIVWGSDSITKVTITEQSVASFLALAAVRPYNTPLTNTSIVWTVVCAHSEIVNDPALSATCTDQGLTAGTRCSKCDAVLVAQEAVAPLGGSHSFVSNKCTKCGIAKGYTWEISGGTLYIRGVGAVTEALEAAYPWHSRRGEITAVVVGDGITEIGPWAFTNCTGMKTLTLGKNVTKLGQDTMSYCTCLEEIVFNGPVTAIGQGVVWGSGNIKKVTITGQTKENFLTVAATHQYNANFSKDTIVWTVK